jgi:outer membrane protein TolC
MTAHRWAGTATPIGALVALVLFMLVLSASSVGAEPPPSPLPLYWCLDRAALENPSIALDEALRDAARERVTPAGALEDPMLGYEASNIPTGDWNFDSTPLSGHQFGLKQRVPFPGVLSNRRAAAEAGAEASTHALENRKILVASSVTGAWAELGFSQRALRITERNIGFLRQLVRIAEAKYRVGTGLQQDVLRAQVELTALLDEKLTREAAIERASGRLAALLDLSVDTRFPETEELSDAAAVPALSELAALLEERNPELLALRAAVDEATRLVRVSKLEGYPDFDLGIGYRLRQEVMGDPVNGDDFVSAGVTVRLPVNRSKWKAKVAEKRALQRSREAAYRNARASLLGTLRSAHAELTRADSETALLRTGLVPQARQSLDSSRSGYEVGRIDFLSLLDSQVRSLDAELRLVRAQADRRQAFAALEAAAGEVLR